MLEMCTREGYIYENRTSDDELMRGREWSELIFLVESSIGNVWKNLNFILDAERINLSPNLKAEFLRPIESLFTTQDLLIAEVYARHPDFVPSLVNFEELLLQ